MNIYLKVLWRTTVPWWKRLGLRILGVMDESGHASGEDSCIKERLTCDFLKADKMAARRVSRSSKRVLASPRIRVEGVHLTV